MHFHQPGIPDNSSHIMYAVCMEYISILQ